MRLGKRDALVLVGFAGISFAYFGWRLLPHPGRELIGSGPDPLIFVWSFAWLPHALGMGTNPFVTHELFAPIGANLTWATSVPGLALVFSPLTLAFGPVASANTADVLLPALAAFSAYRLCLHLTRSTWASLVGGYLFGFSSYILGQQLEGHEHLTGVFALPLIALVVVRFCERSLDGKGLALRLGILVAVELWISIEVALTATLALAIGLLLAYGVAAGSRGRLRASVGPLLAGYVIGALLASPLLADVVIGWRSRGFTGAAASGTDLLNLFVPTSVNGLLGSAFPSLSATFNPFESGLYLGWPVLVVVCLYGWRERRSSGGRFLLAALALGVLVSLGAALHVDGHRVLALPWALVDALPGLDDVSTGRFAVYVSLAAAVAVALWTAGTRGRLFSSPYALPLASVAFLVPAVWQASYVSTPEQVPFFASALGERCIPSGETLLVFPFGDQGDSMLWQAESGFRFRLAEGFLYPLVFGEKPVTAFDADPTVRELDFYSGQELPTMTALEAFAARHGVGRIVSVVGDGYPDEDQLEAVGPVERIGGVLVAPACGRPPLGARPPSAAVVRLEREETEGVTVEYCLGGRSYELPVGVYPTGILRGARRAIVAEGEGLTCASPPPGFRRAGDAPPAPGIPADTYALFAG